MTNDKTSPGNEGQIEDVDLMTMTLAIIGGLVMGGFLFFRAESPGASWLYQAAAFLGTIGLAALFPTARLSAAVGVGIAPFLVNLVQTALAIHRDPTCCNLFPLGLVWLLVVGLPVPLIGGGISRLLSRIQLPRTVYLVPLAGGLLIAALLPAIENAQRHRLENETVPGLLKQIYDAEVVYSARHPNRIFVCDGTMLPGAAGRLGWYHSGDTTVFAVHYYYVVLKCPSDIPPHSFRVSASPYYSRREDTPTFSIDETGKLTVSRDFQGQATGAPRSP